MDCCVLLGLISACTLTFKCCVVWLRYGIVSFMVFSVVSNRRRFHPMDSD